MQNQAGGAPQLSDVGKQATNMAKVPLPSLYKRTLESFQSELADDNMAALHFNHHQKRRIKNLLKLNDVLKMIREQAQHGSMPALPGSAANYHQSSGMSPAHAYASSSLAGTTRAMNAKKNSALMFGLAQRSNGSKSVANRGGS